MPFDVSIVINVSITMDIFAYKYQYSNGVDTAPLILHWKHLHFDTITNDRFLLRNRSKF